jgi:predicted dehydrogenase
MKKYNVGIVGYGWVATAHIPAINATTLGQVTAVCSSRPLDAAELSAKHGREMRVYNLDHPYQTQFEAFFNALDKDRKMPLTSLDAAVASHELVFAAERSLELGRPVRLEEMKETKRVK